MRKDWPSYHYMLDNFMDDVVKRNDFGLGGFDLLATLS
jgi:hypothetical protein